MAEMTVNLEVERRLAGAARARLNSNRVAAERRSDDSSDSDGPVDEQSTD